MLHTNEDRNSNIILPYNIIQMFINYSNPGKPKTLVGHVASIRLFTLTRGHFCVDITTDTHAHKQSLPHRVAALQYNQKWHSMAIRHPPEVILGWTHKIYF